MSSRLVIQTFVNLPHVQSSAGSNSDGEKPYLSFERNTIRIETGGRFLAREGVVYYSTRRETTRTLVLGLFAPGLDYMIPDGQKTYTTAQQH